MVDLQRKFHFTAVMVSHEIPEVFRIASRVAVLHAGRIRAVGRPDEIEHSADQVVRQFIHGEADADVGVV